MTQKGAQEADAGDGQVDRQRELAVVLREVDNPDGRFREADGEHVVGVGEEADAGDEDRLSRLVVVVKRLFDRVERLPSRMEGRNIQEKLKIEERALTRPQLYPAQLALNVAPPPQLALQTLGSP